MLTPLKGFIRSKMFFPLWQRLYRLSLYGMNIGPGGGVAQSGERWVMQYVFDRVSLNKKGRRVLFDVGANKGDYASALLDVFAKSADVYCFEPSKHTHELLENRFKSQSNISTFNIGFGDESGSLSLYSDKNGSTLASLYPRDLNHIGVDMGAVETVELKTLDSFCSERRIKNITLLKLDVEGHELSVLKGASNMITSGSIDFIQFEFGGCNIDSRTYFKDFYLSLYPTYKLFRVLKDGIYPIEQYSEYLESFLTANFLAVSRELD